MTRPKSDPMSIRLFYSYSHKDEAYSEDLEEHLSLLKRMGLIQTWHDRRISAGQEWQNAIDESLDAANVILFLVSAAFLASDYCYDKEMKAALEKHEKGEARVIPIIIRPVDWSGAPFSKLQALPKDAKPVTSWTNRDEAWADVARGIRKAIEEMIASRIREQEPENEEKAKARQKAGGEMKQVEQKKATKEDAKHGPLEKAFLEWGSVSTARTLRGPTKPVNTVAFSPDGSMLASGSGGMIFSGDCTVRLWNVSDGKLLRTLNGHREQVHSVAFSPDGTMLVSASSNNVWLWRVSDGTRIPTFERVASERIALSPDGTTLASTSPIWQSKKTIELWRMSDGEHLTTLKSAEAESGFQSIAFSPDGANLAAVAMRTIFLWHVSDGKILRHFKVSEEESGASSVAFSPDGKTLAAGASSVWLWRVSDGTLLNRLRKQNVNMWDDQGVNSLAFAPNGAIIASGHTDKTVRLWRLSGRKLPLKGHKKKVNCVAFSPDGAMLASGSDDRTV
ncbi:TIR domain-containing protein, partial [candidate division KSB1 bacterium]|nr:TIR domain-containing protein [candidate division KSB1 bacterium]NIR70781.1 TIR domain-containing protein [candidate division KSB1 bacterium]NIS27796.1 TIR domain-containing protein [candidate division KSB1 bacterium]NIT74678.1 TIR domain-containing protein [candidate division KSB1 bacterium]NIU28463.1 TIR domain-containing protein [candidate division KSB1 bacterium]